jgi:hypothetical protein
MKDEKTVLLHPSAFILHPSAEAGMAALEATGLSFVPLADPRTLQLLATSLCLVAALLAAAIVVALVKRWRSRSEAEEDLSPNAQLAHFRSLYEAGTISKEEFERLRALLGARMRETLGVPPKPADALRESEPIRGTSPPPAEPPQTGIQRPDGPESGIRPA